MSIKSLNVLTIAMIVSGPAIAQQANTISKVMDGFPPSRGSLVTIQNYRDHPYSQWSFRNAGAPLHVLMIPRSGSVHAFKSARKPTIATTPIKDSDGNIQTVEAIFQNNHADGVIVVRGNTILYENYRNGLGRDYQHMWFSMTKSLASAALGLLVQQKKVDLSASPAQYIPELKGSAYERATVQDVLNMSAALGFAETYTDTTSFFYKYYGNAGGLSHVNVPGEDANVQTTPVLGTYDFLSKKATRNDNLQPGHKFEYNSSNADVISWIIARVSGKTFNEFIQENIWSKIGAEHDACIVADRALMAAATGGMNTTLRDAALFGTLMMNRGTIDGKQILPPKWIDETGKLTPADKERYARNDVYVKAGMPWVAYKNFWWILDESKGEYAAVGIHGQVIYINRAASLVIAYFSSQPVAGSTASKHFLPKLNACRELSRKL